jgi:hypothetical protein
MESWSHARVQMRTTGLKHLKVGGISCIGTKTPKPSSKKLEIV